MLSKARTGTFHTEKYELVVSDPARRMRNVQGRNCLSLVELKPEKVFADEIDPESFENLNPSGENVPVHHKNWFDSIRANKQPNAGIDLAIKAQTVISLAEMSERLGIACYFDEKNRTVTTGLGSEKREVKLLTYDTEAKAGYHIEKV